VENLDSLPNGWVQSKLSDVADLVGGGTPSREHPEYFTGNIVWLTPTEIPRNRITIISNSKEKITPEGLQKSSARVVPKGSVLMTSRASIGYVAIAGTEVTTNQGFASFICKDSILTEYLAYWLLGNADFFISQATGTTFKEITKSKLRNFTLPVPPLREQERIVERIESLFTQLEAGVAGLKRVRAALKRYKASVLKAACEGRLVSQDPNDEPAEELLRRKLIERKEDFTQPNGDLAELPLGWCWSNLQQISDIIGGITKGRNFRGKKTILLPYLRVANVQRGWLDLSEVKVIELLESEIEKYKLVKDDVVLTEGGDWDKLGRSAIWDDNLPICVHQNHIFRARLKFKDMSSKWIMFYTNSEQGQSYFKDASKQTTNLASINLTQLRNCPIPIPPLPEQARIISEVDLRLSVVQELEQTVEVALKRAGRLRQAILKRAFEGRLVEQDPQDVPI